MRKHFFALFASAFGLFSAVALLTVSMKATQPVLAAGPSIEFDGSSITVGSYPSRICYQAVMDALEAEATLVEPGKYSYQNEYYSPVDPCRPYSGGIVLPGDIYGSQIYNIKCWFKWEPLTWHFVKEEGNLSYFYCTNVIDTHRFQSGSYAPGNDWENSEMRTFLNGEFYARAFSEEERQAVASFTSDQNTSKKALQDNVSLITKAELDAHPTFLRPEATGYAIAKSLLCLNDKNTRAVYYLNSADNTTNPNELDCAESDKTNLARTVNETTVDCEIGVRPLIAVNNANLHRTGGGGGGASGGTNVNVPLILGIIFSILGIGGVIAFFFLWKKGKLIKFDKTKLSIPAAASLGGGAIVAIVGICLLFVGTAGGSYAPVSSPVGYWTTPEFSLDPGSSEFGLRYYLGLSSDHKAYRYWGDAWGDEGKNYTIHPYDGVGSWSINGSKLVVNAPNSWKLFTWETATTSYYPVNGKGFGLDIMIMNEGSAETAGYIVSGHRWYHSSAVDPTGLPVQLTEAGLKP